MTDKTAYILENRLASEKIANRKGLERAIKPSEYLSFKEKINIYFSMDTLYLIRDYIKTYI